MLTIIVPGVESYDENLDQFVSIGDLTLELEHSLVSLSKWESKFEKPFLGKSEKTTEEVLDYIRCMVVTPNPPEEFLEKLSKENLEEVNAYIDRKMTATWFSEAPGAPKTSREVITSELVYYWMTVFHIPFECETWHLNRLFTLIRICNLKQEKPKKMSRAEVAARNRELNAQRKAQLGTKG
jgi:hypothetical protein